MLELEEASKKVFEDKMAHFEKDAMKALMDPEDRQALADLMMEWRRWGERTLKQLSMNESWNMPLYFALSAAVLNRRTINELRKNLETKEDNKVSFSGRE